MGRQPKEHRGQCGSDPGSLTEKAEGRSVTYDLSDLVACQTKDTTATRRFIDPGQIHTVTLQGLQPGERLYYRVGSSDGTALSHFSSVRRHTGALPTSGSGGDGSVHFLYVADMGVGPAQPNELGGALDAEGGAINRENAGPQSGGRLVVEALLRHYHSTRGGLDLFDAVLHNGDVSYACGKGWIRGVSAMIEPIASVLPYQVTLGNHEYDHGDASIPGWNHTMKWCQSWGCRATPRTLVETVASRTGHGFKCQRERAHTPLPLHHRVAWQT